MYPETLVLVCKNQVFYVHFTDYLRNDSNSDYPVLNNKPASFIWKWARMHKAKVYFKSFFSGATQ